MNTDTPHIRYFHGFSTLGSTHSFMNITSDIHEYLQLLNFALTCSYRITRYANRNREHVIISFFCIWTHPYFVGDFYCFTQSKANMAELMEAKQKLLNKLGPNFTRYLQLLGKWFRGTITKDEFDTNAKQLISTSFVSEHNKFWLAFLDHCANKLNNSQNITKTNNSQNITKTNNYTYGLSQHKDTNLKLFPRVDEKLIRSLASDGRFISMSSPLSYLPYLPASLERNPDEPLKMVNKLSFCHQDRCLPNKLMAHMRIFVIAWEMGLDSVDDKVAQLVNLALQYFLKNIITEVICSKTAYRLRENKFRYAFGIKPINPYSTSSNKIYRANLEYDPYQIEATRTNSSLVDTYAYNDSLFPSRLHENQAIFEYACSVSEFARDRKRIKRADDIIGPSNDVVTVSNGISRQRNLSGHKSTLFHLFMTMVTNRCVIPSHALYCVNVERVIAKLSI